MKFVLLLGALFASVLLFGCTQSAPAATAAPTFAPTVSATLAPTASTSGQTSAQSITPEEQAELDQLSAEMNDEENLDSYNPDTSVE